MLADDPSAVVKLIVHDILSTERFRLAWTASEPLCVPVVFYHQHSFIKMYTLATSQTVGQQPYEGCIQESPHRILIHRPG